MTNLSIGGETFRVEVEGDATKPALLLSHSLGADLTLWDAQMPALLKAFRVIRYDSRGHGGSTVEGGMYSIAMLGRDVLGILDALEIEKAHFIGLSMGGMVGQWLLAKAPHRIERAVLANTAAKLGIPAIWNERILRVLDKGMTAVAGDTIERWFGPDFIASQPEKVAAVRTVLESVSPKGYAACCAALRDLDLRGALHDIAAPVLVVSGRHDQSISEDTTRLLVETIPGAKHLALDTRHISNVEADAAFSKAVVGFLTAKLPAKAKRPVESGERAVSTRPATTASRRVGTRRSTAARVPLAGLAKAPAAKASASKTMTRGVIAVTGKGKTEKAKISKVEPPESKKRGKTTLAEKALAATKLPKAKRAKTASAKVPSAKAASTKTLPAKAAPSKATPWAAPAGRAKASTTPARATTARPVQPAKIVKRVSARSLKAMAASPAPKARAGAKAAPCKETPPAASPKSSRGARNTIAAPVVTKARAVPVGKPKTGATKAVKTAKPGTKSATTARETSASPSKTKATKPSAAPSSVATPKATKSNATKSKAPPSKVATKAKPGRRAS